MLLVFLLLTGVVWADEGADAEKNIVRLSPDHFKELPRKIIVELRRNGCTIPQAGLQTDAPNNVIRGSFAKSGQKDWAVLCSKQQESMITIIWGGPAKCTSNLEPRKDVKYLQAMGRDGMMYSRQIDVASADEAGGTHDGISDMFLEKASTIWYCENGKWEARGGSD